MLTPEQQAQILALHFGQKQTRTRIARQLGINRKTVSAVIERRQVRTGAEIGVRKSNLDPFKALLEEKLRIDPTIPATVLLQMLRNQGYPGGISQLRSYVAAIRVSPRPREAFLKLTFEPGECAQVDWGEFGDVFGTGIKIHAFVLVLCYSRRLYVEFTRSEKFEQFIRCHESAFAFLGGAPRECWYDNLATAVTERMGKLIRFNSKFHAYLGHHGIMPYACNPARGNEKGRVEDGVKYLRSSFWPGRTFSDFDDLCAQSREWLTAIANRREHRSTRKIPELVFESEEKQLLLPLNSHAYDTDEVFSEHIRPDYHVVYETNQYSVPWTLVGMSVTVRVTDRGLTFYFHEQLVASHERSYRKHQTFTKPEHEKGLLERKPGSSNHVWRVSAVKSIGPSLAKYLDLLKSSHRSLRFETTKLMALATVYGSEKLHAVIEELLGRGVIGVENIELTLKSQAVDRQSLNPAPLTFQSERLNRVPPAIDLRRYDVHSFGPRQAEAISDGHETEDQEEL